MRAVLNAEKIGFHHISCSSHHVQKVDQIFQRKQPVHALWQVKTFLIFQHIGPGRCSMRVSAVQQFTPGECTLFRLAHNLSMSITPNHCAYVILTHSLPNIPLLWTKTLEHHLLVNCGIRVDLKAATFSLFGQSSTNISAH